MSKKPKPPAEPAAKVMIVDDHPAVREALALRISRQPDLKVCGEAADIPEALRLIDAVKPDLAVIDLSLKNGNGLDLIKRVKAKNDQVRMLVWSMHGESLYAERALRAGALGYITKEEATEKIVEALRAVRAGKVYLSGPLADHILRKVIDGGASKGLPEESLSDRELEAFELFGRGLVTHEVARRMRVSPKTVETYRARIKEKLRLDSVNELIQRAAQWLADRGG